MDLDGALFGPGSGSIGGSRLVGLKSRFEVWILGDLDGVPQDFSHTLTECGLSPQHSAHGLEPQASSEQAIVFQIAGTIGSQADRPAVERPGALSVLIATHVDSATTATALQAGFAAVIASNADAGSVATIVSFARQMLERESDLAQAMEKLQTTNENMAHASRRFEELFHGLPVACFTVSSDGIIHDWNKEAEEAFGITSAEAFMQPIETLMAEPSHGIWSRMTLNEVIEFGDLQRIQWTFSSGDGRDQTFMGTLYPSRGRDGSISGMISANIDITDRVAAHKQIHEQMVQLEDANGQLARLSVTDGLTGLYNHRHFQERLSQAVAASMDSPTSLILLDVDHFKKYNDSFGHVAGDGVLKKVSSLLAELFQEPDVAARYGGEEFAVILRGHSLQEALARAETLRHAIESADWIERAVTASLGVASTTDPTLATKELIRRADEALYQSKEAGRNRVTPFDEASLDQAA